MDKFDPQDRFEFYEQHYTGGVSRVRIEAWAMLDFMQKNKSIRYYGQKNIDEDKLIEDFIQNHGATKVAEKQIY